MRHRDEQRKAPGRVRVLQGDGTLAATAQAIWAKQAFLIGTAQYITGRTAFDPRFDLA